MLEAPLQPPDSPSLAPELPMEQEMVLLQGEDSGKKYGNMWKIEIGDYISDVPDYKSRIICFFFLNMMLLMFDVF